MSLAASKASILLVDDEAAILSALRRVFRPEGYRILTADSGEAGLALLERDAADLVISDMRMPGMDGARFLEQVRERWPRIVRILLTGYADVASTVAAINRGEIYRYIAKPWDDNEMVLTVRQAVERQRLQEENDRLLEVTNRQNEELRALNAGLEEKVRERTAELAEAMARLNDVHGALKKGFLGTVRIFSGLFELRAGKRLGGHSRRVADAARCLAQRMGASESEVQDTMLAGLLHDIGKLGLPDELLDKPFNGLHPEARALVMKHAAIGQNILMAVEQLHAPAVLVRHHHECFDGTGYPDRLSGLAIPMGSRILALVNDFDACQLGTLTQRPLKANEALAFIAENRGKRYDPVVADAFSAWFGETHGEQSQEIQLRPAQLKPGLVLARDLVHKDGYLLLACGQTLDATIISQLQRMEERDGQPLILSTHMSKEMP